MSHRFADIAFTDGVKAAQDHYGSRARNERMQALGGPNAALDRREADFIAERDSFYMATVSQTGWPYVQHRGGPRGFLKVLAPDLLGCADFRGNTQLISAGNAIANPRVALILVDYAEKRRLKILGTLRFEDARYATPETLSQLASPGYGGLVERVMLIEVAAFDWNCSQHIPARFTQTQLDTITAPLHERIAKLEAELMTAAAAPLANTPSI